MIIKIMIGLIFGVLWSYLFFHAVPYYFRMNYYAFKVNGSLNGLILSILGVLAYFVIIFYITGGNDVFHKLDNAVNFCLFVCIFSFALYSLICFSSIFCSYPVLHDHAVDLIKSYEPNTETFGMPILSNMPLTEFGNPTNRDGSALLLVLVDDKWPRFFSQKLVNDPEVHNMIQFYFIVKKGEREEGMKRISKPFYIVYDLKTEPKLLKFDLRTVKKYTHLQEGRSYDWFFLDISEAVKEESIKPILLGGQNDLLNTSNKEFEDKELRTY